MQQPAIAVGISITQNATMQPQWKQNGARMELQHRFTQFFC